MTMCDIDQRISKEKKIKSKLAQTRKIIQNKFKKALKTRIKRERKLEETFKPVTKVIKDLKGNILEQKHSKATNLSSRNQGKGASQSQSLLHEDTIASNTSSSNDDDDDDNNDPFRMLSTARQYGSPQHLPPYQVLLEDMDVSDIDEPPHFSHSTPKNDPKSSSRPQLSYKAEKSKRRDSDRIGAPLTQKSDGEDASTKRSRLRAGKIVNLALESVRANPARYFQADRQAIKERARNVSKKKGATDIVEPYYGDLSSSSDDNNEATDNDSDGKMSGIDEPDTERRSVK